MIKKCAVFLIVLTVMNSCTSSRGVFGRGKFSATDPFLASVPYTRHFKLIIVQAQLEGKTYRFLFDTGAPMVISRELSEQFKMKRLVRKRVQDSQGFKRYLNYVALPDLELAGKYFKNMTAIEADLKASPLLFCLDIDGIIGANMMQLVFWQIDPEKRELRFTNNWNNFRPDSSAAVIPFRTKSTRSPVIEGYLDSLVAGAITFDTGSGGVLGVPRPAGNRYFEDETAVVSVGYHSGGLFGSSPDSITTVVRPFKIGTLPTSRIPIEVERPSSKPLLGMGFIEKFRTTLNWQKKKIYLEPLQDSLDIQERSFGLSPYMQDSVLIVGKCLPKRFAEGHVPVVGDTIVTFNGVKTYPLQRDEFCEIVQLYRNSDSLLVEIKNRGKYQLEANNIFTPVAPLVPLTRDD